MSNTTDRELLAITNFCNLKLEYANLKRSGGDEKTGENHTIYSLLNQEVEAIKSKSDDDRVFNYELGEQEENRNVDENGEIVMRPVYRYVDDFKMNAGLLYGYFLGCKNGILFYN